MTTPLFTSFDLCGLGLRNRVVMAPLTRSRAIGNVPNALMAEYYAQRAGAGLIITEGTSPSPNGLGYARIPGLFDDAQQAGWKAVADAVHAKGGKVFVQLMHTGRVGHPANLPAGARVLAPSPVAAPGEMWTDSSGNQPHPVPVEMTEADIEVAIGEYVSAARRAVAAGIDGVELHGANGYLIDQFLNVATNQRADRWGGSVANRVRFAEAVAKAVTGAIGSRRVGMRVSPANNFNGMAPDPKQDDVYLRLAGTLGGLGAAYLHIVDHSAMGAPGPSAALKLRLREAFSGALILSGGYDAARANADLLARRGDLVAFGRPFISNPRLVDKLRSGAALAQPDFSTFYTPGAKGYTDYPAD